MPDLVLNIQSYRCSIKLKQLDVFLADLNIPLKTNYQTMEHETLQHCNTNNPLIEIKKPQKASLNKIY